MADPSDRFRTLRSGLDALVGAAFPLAEPVEAHGMAGWQVALRDPPQEGSWRGTFDRTHLQVFTTEGKSGITVHIWHPAHPDLLRRHEEALSAAGWKVMVGCLRWTRKGEPPLEPVRAVLESVRE